MAYPGEELKKRASRINRALKKEYHDARTELVFKTPFELLIATILSAQSTDKNVNGVTKKLFEKYKKPEDYVKATPEELEQDIKATGFYRQKTKTLQKCCEALVSQFGGKVPRTLDEMIQLPGVGRKTANMVLGNAFGIPGITVDRHVARVVQRLELSPATNPVQIELDLQKIVPENDWVRFSHALVLHGRYVCTARNPACSKCVLAKMCPFPGRN